MMVMVAKPIAKRCNISISSGLFPSDSKITKLKPLYKKGSKTNPENFRPISLLPLISKVIEKIYHVYAMDFVWALFVWTLHLDFVCDLYIYFERSLFPSWKEDKHASNTTMTTRINITQIANFDTHDESNLAQR